MSYYLLESQLGEGAIPNGNAYETMFGAQPVFAQEFFIPHLPPEEHEHFDEAGHAAVLYRAVTVIFGL